MPIWGGDWYGSDAGIKDTKPPDAGGGLKATKYAGEMTGAVATATPATGAANICNAGTIYAPELEALFAGEL